MKNNSKKTLIKFSIIMTIIATTLIVFFSTYYFSINNSFRTYEKNMSAIVTSINKINDNVGNLYNPTKYTPKVISDDLPNEIQLLNNIKNKLKGISPSQKYKKSYDYLSKGLNNNILMYNYLLILTNNASNKNYETYVLNIKNSVNNCSDYYSLFNMNNLTLTIPNKCNELINTSINHVYETISKQRDKEIFENQLLEFSNKIDDVYSKFCSLKSDYSVPLENTRKNELSYDELINNLDKDINKIKALKENLYAISIPENQAKLYNSFKKLLDSYEDYCESFKYSLTIEKIKTASTEKNFETLNSIYETANTKLSDVNINYDNFMSLYKELKK